MNTLRAEVAIVGGGLAGGLLSIFLAERGLVPLVLEKQPDFAERTVAAGRSINLALAARGIRALERAGVLDEVRPLLIPMRGRMIHEIGRPASLRRYGQRAGEEIYSVSRADLNRALCTLARERHGVEYRFAHECTTVSSNGTASFDTPGGAVELEAGLLVGADGAGSAVRNALAELGTVSAGETLLDHGYKELRVAPTANGAFALEPHALHIWPRGEFMLIALPNLDRSFTATLFLPHEGRTSFASTGADHVHALFEREFPDALDLIPDLETQFQRNPTGILGTVHCRPWSHAGRTILIGDAAHAIVPFHGQGMNAAFEDCVEFDALAGELGPDWPRVATELEARRSNNSRAIAEMALENYEEMRDVVRDERFELKRELAFELERRFPDRFIPRYSMVMFHPEIDYAEAQRLGAAQAQILDELTTNATSLDDIDFDRAHQLIEALR